MKHYTEWIQNPPKTSDKPIILIELIPEVGQADAERAKIANQIKAAIMSEDARNSSRCSSLYQTSDSFNLSASDGKFTEVQIKKDAAAPRLDEACQPSLSKHKENSETDSVPEKSEWTQVVNVTLFPPLAGRLVSRRQRSAGRRAIAQ